MAQWVKDLACHCSGPDHRRGAGSIPGPGTSTCYGQGQKKKKKKRERERYLFSVVF